MLWDCAIDDVQQFLIWREAQAVGLFKIAGYYCCHARIGVEPVNVGGKFESGFVPFVVRHDAVAGIAEPDGSIGVDDQVVRSVELLALIGIHQH